MPVRSRAGIGKSFGSKSPTVRLQISRPPATSARMSPAILRISEPISAPAIALTRSLGSRVIVARTMTAGSAIAKGARRVGPRRPESVARPTTGVAPGARVCQGQRRCMGSAPGGRTARGVPRSKDAAMSIESLATLATLIDRERDPVLAQWRGLVRAMPSAMHLDTPRLNDHLPTLLVELAAALRSADDLTITGALREGSPPVHGLQRFDDGYDIEEVVAEYNVLRDCIHDLAEHHGVRLQGKPFHILNRVLDGAIGMAMQSFAKGQAAAVQRRREEYLAFVAHDLRTPLNAIAVSARVLETKFPKEEASDAQRMLKTLNRNVTRLNVLVRKILDE